MGGRHLGALFAAIALAIISLGAGTYYGLMAGNAAFTANPPNRIAAGPVAQAELSAPCEPGRDNRSSDLCAQWKAADGAYASAWWAMASTIVATLGTLGLLSQIYLTRKALKETAEATAEMRKANRISQDNSHRELRAYLGCKSVKVDETEHDDDEFTIELEIVNHGQTPARIQRIVLQANWVFDDGSTELVNFDGPNIFNCHRETPVSIPCSFRGGFEGCDKDGHIFVVGRLEYEDAFGKRQKEGFGWRTASDEYGRFYDTVFPVHLHAYSVEAALVMIKEQRRSMGRSRA